MRETKNVVYYDAEKNKTTGNGYYTIAYLKDDPAMELKIKEDLRKFMLAFAVENKL